MQFIKHSETEITLEVASNELHELLAVLHAAIDSDPVISDTSTEDMRAIWEKLQAIALNNQAQKFQITLTEKDFRDLTMIVSAVSTQGIENYFPQLESEHGITDERIEAIDEGLWDIRKTVFPPPPEARNLG